MRALFPGQAHRCGFKAGVGGKVQTSEKFPSSLKMETFIGFGWGLKIVEMWSCLERECRWDSSIHNVLTPQDTVSCPNSLKLNFNCDVNKKM